MRTDGQAHIIQTIVTTASARPAVAPQPPPHPEQSGLLWLRDPRIDAMLRVPMPIIAPDPARTADPVPVGDYPRLPDAEQRALVVLSMNRPCWIFPSGSGYVLAVDADDEALIERELAAYELEESQRPPAEMPGVQWVGAARPRTQPAHRAAAVRGVRLAAE